MPKTCDQPPRRDPESTAIRAVRSAWSRLDALLWTNTTRNLVRLPVGARLLLALLVTLSAMD